MKKSELKKLIRETIKETLNEQNLDYGMFVDQAPASALYINDITSGLGGTGEGGGYSVRCPNGYKFEGFNTDVNPGNISVDAANTPFSRFINLAGEGAFMLDRCIKIPDRDIDNIKVKRHRCAAGGVCMPDPDGPYASLQECEASGCGSPRDERDTQTLIPVNPYVGNTGRPSPGGPLEEIVEKISKKLKNKK